MQSAGERRGTFRFVLSCSWRPCWLRGPSLKQFATSITSWRRPEVGKRLDNHVLPFGSTTRHRRPRANAEVRDEERGHDGVATRGAGAFGEGASGRLVD